MAGRDEFCKMVNEELGENSVTLEQMKKIQHAAEKVVVALVKKGEKIQLQGFGTYDLQKQAARKGRNPATGEAIKIPAKKKLRFRAGSETKSL